MGGQHEELYMVHDDDPNSVPEFEKELSDEEYIEVVEFLKKYGL